MKILCINFKKALSIIFIFVICLLSIYISSKILKNNDIAVFKTERLLPIYSVSTNEKKVALTFDCAWGADDITNILDTLRQNQIKATFFMVGKWAEKFPDSVRQMKAEGHDIANHSYTHTHLNSLNIEQIKNEIIKGNTVLNEISGSSCNLFRAPYGEYNDNVVKASEETNQYIIQWSIDSLDWKGLSEEEMKNRIISKLHNGAIILMHNDTANTCKALPSIIEGIKKQGYTIVPVSELIIKDNYYIDHTGKQIKNK